MRHTSVVIADHHPVVLQGLTNILGAESGFQVVASCSNGTNCIQGIRSLAPDIAIIPISMPGLTGLEIRHRQQRESFHAPSLFHRIG